MQSYTPSLDARSPRAAAPPRGGTRLVRVPDRLLLTHLDGRPRDPRVKYFTHVNAGRSYPYSSKRQMGR